MTRSSARTRLCLAVWFVAVTQSQCIFAQDAGEDAAFRAWFDRMIRVGLDNDLLDGVKVSCRVEFAVPASKTQGASAQEPATQLREIAVWRLGGLWR